MGDKEIYPEAVEQEGMSSYKIVAYSAFALPQAYVNLIYSRWMRSFRYGNDIIKLCDSNAYYFAYRSYISKVLMQRDAVVQMAVLTDAPDVVLGFSVSRGTILDYVHVHKDNRRVGIGQKLIPAGITVFTHLTKTGKTIWKNKYKDWKFNLFA